MTEREMLEYAARACGIQNARYFAEDDFLSSSIEYDDENDCTVVWVPHLSDGDCTRMEALLGIDVEWKIADQAVKSRKFSTYAYGFFSEHKNDRKAARRMASLMVAAEIGQSMP